MAIHGHTWPIYKCVFRIKHVIFPVSLPEGNGINRHDAEACWNPFGASLKSPTAVLLKDLPGSNVAGKSPNHTSMMWVCLKIVYPMKNGYNWEYTLFWVCLKMVSTPKPNGFADHYPVFKWLFHWEYTLFSGKPMFP